MLLQCEDWLVVVIVCWVGGGGRGSVDGRSGLVRAVQEGSRMDVMHGLPPYAPTSSLPRLMDV